MAFTTGSATVSFVAADPSTFGLATNINVGTNQTVNTNFSFGAGANEFQLMYPFPRTFSGSTDVLNLTSGLADPDGTAIIAARIKGVMFINTGNANIVIGVGTDPVSTLLNAAGTITLPPGAWFAAATPDATGWVVTASTACNITVTGTSGQTYNVVLFVSNS